jgi:hypothetical protein
MSLLGWPDVLLVADVLSIFLALWVSLVGAVIVPRT